LRVRTRIVHVDQIEIGALVAKSAATFVYDSNQPNFRHRPSESFLST
jgi:hypothetical protein